MDNSLTARLPGVLLFIMALLAVAASISSLVSPVWSGLAGWSAALLLFRRLPRAMVYQISGMLLIGAGCIVWAMLSKLPLDLARALSANIHVIALIASVTFLRLISLTGEQAQTHLPSGRTSLVKTAQYLVQRQPAWRGYDDDVGKQYCRLTLFRNKPHPAGPVRDIILLDDALECRLCAHHADRLFHGAVYLQLHRHYVNRFTRQALVFMQTRRP